MKALVITILLFCASFSSLSYGSTSKRQEVPAEIAINRPTTVSTSYYDIDRDGKKESIEIILLKGKKINEEEPWCGAGERWEGDFIVRVQKGKKVLSHLSLNKNMGESKGEELSFWAPRFTLVFRDYNGDGEIDFNLGQYSICEGNDYWLFTIRRDGKIELLPIDDVDDWLFIQNPSHINSTDQIKLDNGLLKHTSYDRLSEIEYTTWYKWSGKKFVIAKEKRLSFKEPFKSFSIKKEQLVGIWESDSGDDVHGTVELKADGTFQATCPQRGIVICKNITGKWHVRENHLIWIYDEDYNVFKRGQEDVNTIIDFETNQVLLREMNGEVMEIRKVGSAIEY